MKLALLIALVPAALAAGYAANALVSFADREISAARRRYLTAMNRMRWEDLQ